MQHQPDPQPQSQSLGATRRDFMKTSAAVAGAAAVASVLPVGGVYAAGSDVIKVGLIGCGGRGSGAALNALHGDDSAQITSMGDMFMDKLEASLERLKKEEPKRVNVANDKKFAGFDAFKGVIEASDVVLLATPPHFRPMHRAAALDAN